MTPEQTIRLALALGWGIGDTLTGDKYDDALDALDALVAERDALAARLAEAERQRDEFKKTAFDMHDFGSEWKIRAREAEARVAALTEALRGIAEACRGLGELNAVALATDALAAADRPEGTTPPETGFAGTPPHLQPNGGSCTCTVVIPDGQCMNLDRSRCPIHGERTTP